MVIKKELTLKAKLALFKKVGILDYEKNKGIKEIWRGGEEYLTFGGVTYRYIRRKKLYSADIFSDSFIRNWDPATEKVLVAPTSNPKVFWHYRALKSEEEKALPKLAGGKWKDLDYWIWCLFTLDDEESRLADNPDEVVSDFLKAGGPKSQIPKIYKMIRTMTRSDLSTDKLLNLLKPYASHQSLMKAGTWEEQYNMHIDEEDE